MGCVKFLFANPLRDQVHMIMVIFPMIFPPTLFHVCGDITKIAGLVVVIGHAHLLLIHFGREKKKLDSNIFFRSQILTAGDNFIVEEGLQHNFAFLGLC